MEPVFMICGESAGIAACHALSEGKSVQEIDPKAFRKALESVGQKLVWDAPARAASPQASYTFQALLAECDRNSDKLISHTEWNDAKSGWEWLFAFVDKDRSGQITEREYQDLQALKARHPKTWQTELKR